MTEEPNQNTPSRRSVLKLIGGATGAAATLPGAVSAGGQSEQNLRSKLKNQYNEPEKALQAIRENGVGILEHLAERGILQTTEISELVPSSLQSAKEHRNSATGVFVSSFEFDDEYSARISAAFETDSHAVELFIHPHVDVHYGVVKPSDEESDPFVVESTDDGPDPQDLCKQDGEICRYEGNDYDCCPPLLGCTNTSFEKIICRSGDCYAGSHTGCCNLPASC